MNNAPFILLATSTGVGGPVVVAVVEIVLPACGVGRGGEKRTGPPDDELIVFPPVMLVAKQDGRQYKWWKMVSGLLIWSAASHECKMKAALSIARNE